MSFLQKSKKFVINNKILSAIATSILASILFVQLTPFVDFSQNLSEKYYNAKEFMFWRNERSEFRNLTEGSRSYPFLVAGIEDEETAAKLDIDELFELEKSFISELTDLARSGYPEAQLYLAETYTKGLIFQKSDPSKCKKWMDFAKKNSHPKADLNKC